MGAFWSLLDGIWGILKGSWGVLRVSNFEVSITLCHISMGDYRPANSALVKAVEFGA